MKTIDILKFGAALVTAIALSACGDDSSSSPNDDYSSVASFRSSSSLSDRADIDYKDTVDIGDTMKVYIELFKGDSSKMDESVLYLDSSATAFPLYLGELPKGSRITIFANTASIPNDTIRVKSELGDYLRALTAVPKNKGKDSTFGNYLVPSIGQDTTAYFKDSNQFVVFNANHYYLEIGGKFSDTSSLRFKVKVDTSYYAYTGDTAAMSIKTNDIIRGIIPIDNAPGKIKLNFSANEGYSINLTVKGKNIELYKLTDGDSILGQSESNIDTMLVPNDSVNWAVQIEPASFSNIWTGPFAYFETTTKSRHLEQGEYFSKPDSIIYPGEVFLRSRPKDNRGVYKYNLRQEQFVWIGDYKKGDSVIVSHGISNYSIDGTNNKATCEILDKNKKVQDKFPCTYEESFSIKEDMPEGPYYLHYLRLNSDPLDQGLKHDSLRYVLQLSTMVQQPGLLETFHFYDPRNESASDMTQMSIHAGDTVLFSAFRFLMEAKDGSYWKNKDIGTDINWYVPCSSLDYINSLIVDKQGNNTTTKIYDKESCESEQTKEQEISSNSLIGLEDGIGNTALLIAQSVADPAKRDTLKIPIIAKASN